MSISLRRVLAVAGLVAAASTLSITAASAAQVGAQVRATSGDVSIPVGGFVPVPVDTGCMTVSAGNSSVAAASVTACYVTP